MISNGINPVQSPAQSFPVRPARAGKARAHRAETPVDKHPAVPDNSSRLSTAATTAAAAGPNPTVSNSNTLTAALPPMSDGDQAAAATQHARLLIQAHARLALIAQANSTSQSVQRLLQ